MMLPSLQVFLDVDDLDEGSGTAQVDLSEHVIVFITVGYTASLNCMAEFVRAWKKDKRITLMLEPSALHGALPGGLADVEAALSEALNERSATGRKLKALVRDWHAAGEVASDELPRADDLMTAICEETTLYYSRVRLYLDETMRLLAESHAKTRHDASWRSKRMRSARHRSTSQRLGPQASISSSPRPSPGSSPRPTPIYIRDAIRARTAFPRGGAKSATGSTTQGSGSLHSSSGCSESMMESSCESSTLSSESYFLASMSQKTVVLSPPRFKRRFHIYCSSKNEGAKELIEDVAKAMHVQATFTSKFEEMELCEFFMVYLTARTWTSGRLSASFAIELEAAMRKQMLLLLCYEEPGIDHAVRHAAPFESFFVNPEGATPRNLVNAGVYRRIAVPLQGGALRPASMALVAVMLGAAKEASTLPALLGSSSGSRSYASTGPAHWGFRGLARRILLANIAVNGMTELVEDQRVLRHLNLPLPPDPTQHRMIVPLTNLVEPEQASPNFSNAFHGFLDRMGLPGRLSEAGGEADSEERPRRKSERRGSQQRRGSKHKLGSTVLKRWLHAEGTVASDDGGVTETLDDRSDNTSLDIIRFSGASKLQATISPFRITTGEQDRRSFGQASAITSLTVSAPDDEMYYHPHRQRWPDSDAPSPADSAAVASGVGTSRAVASTWLAQQTRAAEAQQSQQGSPALTRDTTRCTSLWI